MAIYAALCRFAQQVTASLVTLSMYKWRSGSMLLTVIMFSVVATTLTGSMLVIANIALKTELNRALYVQLEGTAQSAAQRDIQALLRGNTVKTRAEMIGGIIGLETTLLHPIDTPMINLEVVASSGGRMVTLKAAYDTISKKVVAWQDNGPAK